MPTKLENQITAIIKAIDKGKCRNKYSAIAKVRKLKKRMKSNYHSIQWQNFLAQ